MLDVLERPSSANTVWHFLPGTGQELALNISNINEMLLCGGRGWGKTDCQLMRFRTRVGKGYGTHWRGIIFDKEYKNLDDLIVKSRRLFNDFDEGYATFLSSNSALKWVWKTGEELLFRVAKDENDYWTYHGHEYPYVGWNELTKYATGKLYSRMRSVNRSGFDPVIHTPRVVGDNWAAERSYQFGREVKVGDYDTEDGNPLPPIPLEIVSTTNPYGAGHNWVKTDFIDVQTDYGEVVNTTRTVFNPKTQQEETVTRRQVAIFGTFRENPFLSMEYISGLYEDNDENIIKAWIDGDWNIVAGGAFDDVFRMNIHILPRFKVPFSWKVDRSMDWGSSHPCSIGWWAEANGEETTFLDKNGNTRVFCPPRGTLIQIGELYFTKKIGTNEGTKATATEVAQAVVAYENRLWQEGWVVGKPSPGPADNQIRDVRESDVDTIETKMAKQKVTWEYSDKAPGTRKIGLELMRDRYLAAKKGIPEPALYHMENCRASIATIPVLPRDDKDPEDVDTGAEDHPYDMTRYRCLKGSSRYAKKLQVSFPR
jgi:hypothetical protein